MSPKNTFDKPSHEEHVVDPERRESISSDLNVAFEQFDQGMRLFNEASTIISKIKPDDLRCRAILALALAKAEAGLDPYPLLKDAEELVKLGMRNERWDYRREEGSLLSSIAHSYLAIGDVERASGYTQRLGTFGGVDLQSHIDRTRQSSRKMGMREWVDLDRFGWITDPESTFVEERCQEAQKNQNLDDIILARYLVSRIFDDQGRTRNQQIITATEGGILLQIYQEQNSAMQEVRKLVAEKNFDGAQRAVDKFEMPLRDFAYNYIAIAMAEAGDFEGAMLVALDIEDFKRFNLTCGAMIVIACRLDHLTEADDMYKQYSSAERIADKKGKIPENLYGGVDSYNFLLQMHERKKRRDADAKMHEGVVAFEGMHSLLQALPSSEKREAVIDAVREKNEKQLNALSLALTNEEKDAMLKAVPKREAEGWVGAILGTKLQKKK